MSQRSALRVAVIGYGSIGRRHVDNLAKLGVSRRVIVRRQSSANPAFAPPADVRIVHSDRQAIEAGIDLAIVCNPTALHPATAETYLVAGIPVLIEKPLCAPGDEEAAARLASAAREQGCFAGMAYCLRYHPAYRLAHEIVTSGGLGRLRSARAWFESYLPDWHPWEDYRQSYAARAELGGGVLPTLDHEIDFLNWCLGEPVKITGWQSNSGTLEIEVPDRASLSLTYGGPVTADVSLSFCRRERSRGFEFLGQDGTLRFDWQQATLQRVAASGACQVLWCEPDYEVNHMYEAGLDDFLHAVVGRIANQSCVQSIGHAPVPLAAGLATARICHTVKAFEGMEAKGVGWAKLAKASAGPPNARSNRFPAAHS
jgi:predicted dehydrogenase